MMRYILKVNKHMKERWKTIPREMYISFGAK